MIITELRSNSMDSSEDEEVDEEIHTRDPFQLELLNAVRRRRSRNTGFNEDELGSVPQFDAEKNLRLSKFMAKGGKNTYTTNGSNRTQNVISDKWTPSIQFDGSDDGLSDDEYNDRLIDYDKSNSNTRTHGKTTLDFFNNPVQRSLSKEKTNDYLTDSYSVATCGGGSITELNKENVPVDTFTSSQGRNKMRNEIGSFDEQTTPTDKDCDLKTRKTEFDGNADIGRHSRRDPNYSREWSNRNISSKQERSEESYNLQSQLFLEVSHERGKTENDTDLIDQGNSIGSMLSKPVRKPIPTPRQRSKNTSREGDSSSTDKYDLRKSGSLPETEDLSQREPSSFKTDVLERQSVVNFNIGSDSSDNEASNTQHLKSKFESRKKRDHHVNEVFNDAKSTVTANKKQSESDMRSTKPTRHHISSIPVKQDFEKSFDENTISDIFDAESRPGIQRDAIQSTKGRKNGMVISSTDGFDMKSDKERNSKHVESKDTLKKVHRRSNSTGLDNLRSKEQITSTTVSKQSPLKTKPTKQKAPIVPDARSARSTLGDKMSEGSIEKKVKKGPIKVFNPKELSEKQPRASFSAQCSNLSVGHRSDQPQYQGERQSRIKPQTKASQSKEFQRHRSLSFTNISNVRPASPKMCVDPGHKFASSTNVRNQVYHEWLLRKKMAIKEQKQVSKKDMQKGETEKIERERSRKIEVEKAFEAWNSSKTDSAKEKHKLDQEKKEKKKEKEDDAIQKKLDAKKYYESWKSTKDDELKEQQRKKILQEREAKKKTSVEKTQKDDDAKRVFENWKSKKDEILKEKKVKAVQKQKEEKKKDLTEKEKKEKAQRVFEKWKETKDTQRRPTSATLVQRPWCPSSRFSSNTIPERIQPVIGAGYPNRAKSVTFIRQTSAARRFSTH